MSRIKTLLPLITLAALLLWPAIVLADDLTPDTCLSLDGMCYAANVVLDGTDSLTNPDGTAMAPWLTPRDGTFTDFRNKITTALQTAGHPYGDGPFYYIAILCEEPTYEPCSTHYIEYDGNGQKTGDWTDPGIPPEVGVELPFSFLLGGGAVLGGLLLGVGIVLQRKAKS